MARCGRRGKVWLVAARLVQARLGVAGEAGHVWVCLGVVSHGEVRRGRVRLAGHGNAVLGAVRQVVAWRVSAGEATRGLAW